MKPCEACGGSGEVRCNNCNDSGIGPNGSECADCRAIRPCSACQGTGRWSFHVGDIVSLGKYVGVVARMLGGHADILWDNQTVHYSGGPKGPPGPMKETEPQTWPLDSLTPAKCQRGCGCRITVGNTVVNSNGERHHFHTETVVLDKMASHYEEKVVHSPILAQDHP